MRCEHGTAPRTSVRPRCHAAVLAVAVALSVGCSSRAPSQPADGAWRDQYVFVGDAGEVVPLVLWRSAAGRAEAKGWLGFDGRWQHSFYHRYPIDGARAASPEDALRALSSSANTPVRGRLEQVGDALSLELHTRTSAMTLTAGELAELGRARDPEGATIYRAGRAALTVGDRQLDGWVIIEQTPAAQPRRPFVDYGEFLLVFAATRDRVLVLRQSRTTAGYDHAFERAIAGPPRARPAVRADRERGGVRVVDGDVELAMLPVRDVAASAGVAPDGRPVRYELLLFGGAGWSGAAFAIGPAQAQ